jgi:hypothetical protein
MMTHIFFLHNLSIKSVLAIGTLYLLMFCLFEVVYGIVFVGVTPDIKIISFGVRRLKNRRVTPRIREHIGSVIGGRVPATQGSSGPCVYCRKLGVRSLYTYVAS